MKLFVQCFSPDEKTASFWRSIISFMVLTNEIMSFLSLKFRLTKFGVAALSLHKTDLPKEQLHKSFPGWSIHRIPNVFSRTLDPNWNSRVAATIIDVSSPTSILQHEVILSQCVLGLSPNGSMSLTSWRFCFSKAHELGSLTPLKFSSRSPNDQKAKETLCSVKNQDALFTRWATWN